MTDTAALEIDIDSILKDAQRCGKISKQQRAAWIRQVIEVEEKVLTIKQVAEVIGCSYDKVQKDWKRGRIPDAVKLGDEDSRSPVIITKQGAIDYILEFDGTDYIEDPKQRRLPFPGFYDDENGVNDEEEVL